MLWANAAALALFVAPRIALARLREIGYDEQFTLWTSRKPIAALIETLRLDSGPALHYLIVKVLQATTIGAARAVSIAAAIAALFVAMSVVRRPLDRLIVGALFAVYPLHIYFSAEARAYAFCALTVGIAAVALDRWIETDRHGWLVIAELAIAATAYAHYYGLFLVPLPVVMAFLFRRELVGRAVLATIVIGLLFLPALPLFLQQLPNAVPWMAIESDAARIFLATGTFLRIGFDGRQVVGAPDTTTLLRMASMTLLAVALWGTFRRSGAPAASAGGSESAAAEGGRGSTESRRYLVIVVVPMLMTIGAAAAGLRGYFPLKFESILSVPVVLWFFFSAPVERRARTAFFAAAVIVGAIASSAAFTGRARTFAPMRAVTKAVAASTNPATRIVATGPSFVALSLERATTPLPAAHAVHPSIEVPRAQLEREAAQLQVPLVWVGDMQSDAFDVLRRRYALQLVVRRQTEVAVIVREQ